MLTLTLVFELVEKLKLPQLSLVADKYNAANMRISTNEMFDNRFFTVVMLSAQALVFAVLILGPSGLLSLIFGAPKVKKERVPFQTKKHDDDGFFNNLFRNCGAKGGAMAAAGAIGLTLGLNIAMGVVRFVCMMKVAVQHAGRDRKMSYDERVAFFKNYLNVITLQGQLNLLADSLLYIGVLIVWISLVVSGEMCGKAKRAEEDGAEADVEEGKKEGDYANFGAQNQAHPCGGYGANQTASYPYPAAVPTTYPYNTAVSQPAYPAVCQPTVPAPYYK